MELVTVVLSYAPVAVTMIDKGEEVDLKRHQAVLSGALILLCSAVDAQQDIVGGHTGKEVSLKEPGM